MNRGFVVVEPGRTARTGVMAHGADVGSTPRMVDNQKPCVVRHPQDRT